MSNPNSDRPDFHGSFYTNLGNMGQGPAQENAKQRSSSAYELAARELNERVFTLEQKIAKLEALQRLREMREEDKQPVWPLPAAKPFDISVLTQFDPQEVERKRLYWAAYHAVVGPVIANIMVASPDQIDIDVNRAHRVAQAAAERAHGPLEKK